MLAHNVEKDLQLSEVTLPHRGKQGINNRHQNTSTFCLLEGVKSEDYKTKTNQPIKQQSKGCEEFGAEVEDEEWAVIFN